MQYSIIEKVKKDKLKMVKGERKRKVNECPNICVRVAFDQLAISYPRLNAGNEDRSFFHICFKVEEIFYFVWETKVCAIYFWYAGCVMGVRKAK